jgi:hypothetical protein
MVRFKKEKNSPIIVSENGKIIKINPRDLKEKLSFPKRSLWFNN